MNIRNIAEWINILTFIHKIIRAVWPIVRLPVLNWLTSTVSYIITILYQIYQCLENIK